MRQELRFHELQRFITGVLRVLRLLKASQAFQGRFWRNVLGSFRGVLEVPGGEGLVMVFSKAFQEILEVLHGLKGI